jgi:hypothetical protein
MDNNISTLRPGVLCLLKTQIKGKNLAYSVTEIEADHLEPDGTLKKVTETTRTVADPAEYDAAVKTRGKASSLIRSPCIASNFGLICPEDRREQLFAKIAEAEATVSDFNATSKLTQVGVYTILGRVAPDDAQALRAINSEMRDAFEAMSAGVKKLDAEAVREAASKAKQMAAMLPDNMQDRVQDAVKAVRSFARKATKAASLAAEEIDEETVRKLNESRTKFLDMAAPLSEAFAEVEEQSARVITFEEPTPQGEADLAYERAVIMGDVPLAAAPELTPASGMAFYLDTDEE